MVTPLQPFPFVIDTIPPFAAPLGPQRVPREALCKMADRRCVRKGCWPWVKIRNRVKDRMLKVCLEFDGGHLNGAPQGFPFFVSVIGQFNPSGHLGDGFFIGPRRIAPKPENVSVGRGALERRCVGEGGGR